MLVSAPGPLRKCGDEARWFFLTSAVSAGIQTPFPLGSGIDVAAGMARDDGFRADVARMRGSSEYQPRSGGSSSSAPTAAPLQGGKIFRLKKGKPSGVRDHNS